MSNTRAGRRPRRRAAPKSAGVTTIGVSTAFAEALKERAKSEGISVAAVCDREYLSDAQRVARDVLQERLQKMVTAGG